MKKVLLLSMPFGALGRPALGISELKSALNERLIPCDLQYPTYSFASPRHQAVVLGRGSGQLHLRCP